MLPNCIRYPGHEFLHTCPQSLIYRTPVITETIKAHRWCKGLGQSLSDLYPNGIPAIVAEGIVALESGFNQADMERREKIEENRRREEAERKANQIRNGSGR